MLLPSGCRQLFLYGHMNNRFYFEQGFIGLYLTIVVLTLMLGIIISIGSGVVIQQRIVQNTVQSAQAYAAAESGVEDILIRLVNEQNICDPPGSPPCSNSLGVGSASTTVEISSIVCGARTITSKGNSSNRVRTAQVVYQLVSESVSFNFGAHIGNPSIACTPFCGGLEMEHNDS